MVNPPTAYVKRGKDAVVRYFQSIQKEEQEYLYEAKLLILGAPEAGKTTLARKIKDITAEMPEKDERTHGIELTKWGFTHDFVVNGKQDIVVNIWDFGGQTILKHTHRFFLTQRSIYIILADGAKDGKKYFKYWIHQTKEFGGSSPVMIFINEVNGYSSDIKIEDFQKINNHLLNDSIAVDLKYVDVKYRKKFGLGVELIKSQVVNLNGFGERIITGGKGVRKALMDIENSDRKIIFRSEYVAICERNGIKDEKDQMDLSFYFHHQIGVFLHFQDNEILQRYIFINNQWVLNGAYAILQNEKVTKANGKLSKKDFWNLFTKEYQDYKLEIKELLKVFYLIYEKGEYIVVPQHLTESKLEYTLNDEKNVHFRFQYTQYRPEGILWQFIVEYNQYIKDDLVWKEGVVLQIGDTVAEIIEDTENDLIKIRVVGSKKEDLRANIIMIFDNIHNGFNDLKVEKLVPCVCDSCGKASEPFHFKYDLLCRLKIKKSTILCENSLDDVEIDRLLYGVQLDKRDRLGEINVSGSRNIIINRVDGGKFDIRHGVDEQFGIDEKSGIVDLVKGLHERHDKHDADLNSILKYSEFLTQGLSEEFRDLNNYMIDLLDKSDQKEMALLDIQSFISNLKNKEEKAKIQKILDDERGELKVKISVGLPAVIANFLPVNTSFEYSRKSKTPKFPKSWLELKALFVGNQ